MNAVTQTTMPTGIDLAQQVETWIENNKEHVIEEVNAWLEATAPRVLKLRTILGSKVHEEDIEIHDFVFPDPGTWTYHVAILKQSRLTNKSSAKLTEGFSYSEEVQDSFEFGFSQGLKLGARAQATAQLGVVEAQVEISAEVEFTADQRWTVTEVKSWSQDIDIELEPHSAVEATATLEVGKNEFNFTATATLRYARVAILGFNTAGVIQGANLSTSILKIPLEPRQAEISGTLEAELGLTTTVEVKDVEPDGD